MAALDIKTHPVFNLEEQLALFDGSKGQSKAAKWMADIAEFFAGVGRITPDELKVVKDGSYALPCPCRPSVTGGRLAFLEIGMILTL